MVVIVVMIVVAIMMIVPVVMVIFAVNIDLEAHSAMVVWFTTTSQDHKNPQNRQPNPKFPFSHLRLLFKINDRF